MKTQDVIRPRIAIADAIVLRNVIGEMLKTPEMSGYLIPDEKAVFAEFQAKLVELIGLVEIRNEVYRIREQQPSS